jgi:hypothetical protein
VLCAILIPLIKADANRTPKDFFISERRIRRENMRRLMAVLGRAAMWKREVVVQVRRDRFALDAQTSF